LNAAHRIFLRGKLVFLSTGRFTMLRIAFAAVQPMLVAASIHATPTSDNEVCRATCTCVTKAGSLTRHAKKWRQTTDSAHSKIRWFVGTATGVAQTDSTETPETKRTRIGSADYITTFSVDQVWSLDPAAASASPVRITTAGNWGCPVPKWVPGERYLVVVTPDSTGRFSIGECNFAMPINDKELIATIKALGKPTWKRTK
jgi:hypothetical protein